MSYDDPQGKLFIGGISWETTDEEFLNFFQEFGYVSDHIIMRKPDGQSRGFGFVTFDDPNVAQKVISQDLRLGGRRIDCKAAIPRGNSYSRGSGGGGYGGGGGGGGGGRYGDRGRSSRGPRTCKIFVGGLSRDTQKDEFEDYFSQYGRVIDAVIMVDRETQHSRGFGFVTYETENSVENVLSQPVHIITDKTVECKRAIPKDSISEPSTGGNVGGGGYGRGYGSSVSGGYSANYTSRSSHDTQGGYGDVGGGIISSYTPTYPQVTAYGVPTATYPQLSSNAIISSYAQYAGLTQSQTQLPQTISGQTISPYSSYAVSTPYISQSIVPGTGLISQSDSQGSYGAVSRDRDTRSYHPYGRR